LYKGIPLIAQSMAWRSWKMSYVVQTGLGECPSPVSACD